MKFTQLLASTAALAAFAIVMPSALSPGWSPVSTAQAATSVSFSVFYEGLDADGDWISRDGDYVFVPAIKDRDWQPYTRGRWVHTSGYGWTWVSDERFGWATYHYGRWGFDQNIGWYWVPGTRWAPAWVSWRRSGDYVSWAPLPPRRGGNDNDDVSITINIDTTPDYYWVAVPSRRFLDVDLSVVAVRDDRERRRIVSASEFVGSVQVTNNVVVNNVININYVEKNTGKKVRDVKIRKSDKPENTKAGDEQVEVFDGRLEPDKVAKPAKLKDVAEVKQNQVETKKRVKAETEAAAEANPEAAPVQAGEDTPPTKTPKAKPPEGQPAAGEDPGVMKNDAPVEKPLDKKTPAAGQAEDDVTNAPVEKKKKPAVDKAKDAAVPAPDDKTQKEKVKKPDVPAPAVEVTAEPAPTLKKKQPPQKKAKAEKPAGDIKARPGKNQANVKKKPVRPAQQAKKVKPRKAAVPCDPAVKRANQKGCVPQ